MSLPTILSTGETFIIRWENEGIEFKLNRILEKAGAISAEVIVTKAGGHLYHARVNILSSHSKRIMVNELAKRITLDWDTMIEQAFSKMLTEYRRGEPVIRIQNDNELQPLEYTLYPLLLKGEHNVLFGDGGTGKSLVAGLIAILVQFNTSHLGLTPEAGNVLFLDWETSQKTVTRRASAIRRGLDLTGEGFFYRFCEQPLVNEIEEIRGQVIESDISLVIADSAGMASGMDGDYHSVAIKYARALRSLKTTCLSIDHIAKGEGHTPFGSIYKRNIARSAFRIKHSQNPGDQDLYVALFHDKMNEGARQKPMGLHIHFEGTGGILEKITFDNLDVTAIPELAEGLPLKARIADLLKYGALISQDIAEQLDAPKGSIETILYRNKNLFVRLGTKEWGLLGEDEPNNIS